MSKKILLVEDNYQTHNIINTKLKKLGYHTTHIVLGEKATEVAKKIKPDLIVLDILLEGELTGIEVLEKIKKDKLLKDIPVIILTNLDNQKYSAEKLGASEYLIKANASLTEIVDRIADYLKT